MATTTPANASDAYKDQIRDIVNPVPAPGTAAANRAALQAALDAGGYIHITHPETYLIDQPLVMYSDTTLNLGGATIKNDADVKDKVITNNAFANEGTRAAVSSLTADFMYFDDNPVEFLTTTTFKTTGSSQVNAFPDGKALKITLSGVPTACTVNGTPTYDSGTKITTITVSGITLDATLSAVYIDMKYSVKVVSTAHGFVNDDPVSILGSTSTGYNGVFLVASVEDADTFYVFLPVYPTVTTALGTITLSAADRNIKIMNGVVDYDVDNNQIGGGAEAVGVLLKNVYQPSLEELFVTNTDKFAVLLAACSSCYVRGLSCETESDGLHFQGPIIGAHVENLTGQCGEDLLSLTAGDFASIEQSAGDFFGVLVEGIRGRAINTANIIKLAGKAEFWFYDITVDGLNALPSEGNLLRITTDQDLDGTNVKFLRVNNVTVQGEMPSHAFYIRTTDTVVDTFVLDGVVADLFDADSTPFIEVGNAAVESMLIANVFVNGTANSSFMRTSGAGSIGFTCISNSHFNDTKHIYAQTGTSVGAGAVIQLSNVSGVSVERGIFLTGATPVVMLDNVNIAGATFAFVGTTNANVTGARILAGNVNVATNLIRFDNGSYSCSGMQAKVDSTDAQLSPIRGDVILDTSNNNDPYRYNGTSWAAM